ncbi:MAG TPA: PaaI family thioesterase [Dehalococcoidia bacterium]|nr:PaaI family thioesterase [Dehalococcoidia bacterium]
MNAAWQQNLIELFRAAPIARLFGMALSFDEQGHAYINLPYNPNLDHAAKGIHGGVIATMLDTAGWFAVAAHNEGIWIATSEFKIHLLNPVKESELHAEGWVIKSGKRISVAEMRVSASSGELIAIGTGTYVTIEGVPLGENDP